VGGARAVARLEEQAVLADGTKIDYALGVSVGKYRGLRTVSHGGSDAGYRSYVTWFPDQRLGVVVLSNLASFNPGVIANQVAEVYLGSQMSTENPGRPAALLALVNGPRAAFAPFDAKDLPAYAGIYWSEELETQYDILLKDGKLMADHAHHGEIALTPFGKDEFRGGAWFMPEVRFQRDSSGKVTAMLIGGGRVTGVRFTRRRG
jgi:hypothetical protein